MKKWLKRLSVTILGIVVFLFLFLLEERFRGQISLARLKKSLAAQGEKIDPSDFALPPSKEENGVPAIRRAIPQLKPGTILPNDGPPKMELLPSGHAIVGFQESEWVSDHKTNSWNAFALEWKTNETILFQIRDALEKPVLNSDLNYALAPHLPFTNLASCRKLSFWFGGGSELSLHEGKNTEALERLLPQIRLPRLIESDRLAISELVRIALAAIAKNATWEALQYEGWTDEDLRKIQAAWEREEFIDSTITALQGELVFDEATYQVMRRSNKETFQILFGMEEFLAGTDWEPPVWETVLRRAPGGDAAVEFLKKQIFCRIWSFAWSHQHQYRSARGINRLLQTTRAFAKGKSFSEVRVAIEQFKSEAIPKNFYDSLRYPEPLSPFSLANVIEKTARVQTERSMTLCAVALQRYALRNGKFPASLNLLVPEFIGSVPIDYFDGEPMKYFLNDDGTVTLYSVGEDGQDNQGNSSLVSGKSGRSIWDRKDAVWPAPATPEEVAAFRTQAAKK